MRVKGRMIKFFARRAEAQEIINSILGTTIRPEVMRETKRSETDCDGLVVKILFNKG